MRALCAHHAKHICPRFPEGFTEFHVAEVDGRPYLGKDPTGGGLVLDVPSLEERKREEEERKKKGVAVVPTLKFKATGNEVKKVKDEKIQLDPTQGKPKK